MCAKVVYIIRYLKGVKIVTLNYRSYTCTSLVPMPILLPGLGHDPRLCHTISGPPGLSIATVHGPPAIYKRGQGLGFRIYMYMVSRVSLKGLYGRVRLQGLYGKYGVVDSPGGPQFWGDRRQLDSSGYINSCPNRGKLQTILYVINHVSCRMYTR